MGCILDIFIEIKEHKMSKEKLNVNNIKTIIDLMFDCFVKGKEKLPLTCYDCGRELTDDEVTTFYDDIEDDDDKPYCNVCAVKMATTEGLVDDSLMEGK